MSSSVALSSFHSAFLADDEYVTMIPNLDYNDKIPLLSSSSSSSTVGPFEAAIPVQVPLWLGLLFQQRCLGTIVIPDWCNTEEFVTLIDNEKGNDKMGKLPHKYFEPLTYRFLSTLQNQKNNSSSTTNAHHEQYEENDDDDDMTHGNTTITTNGGSSDCNPITTRLLLEDLLQIRKDKLLQQFLDATAQNINNQQVVVTINDTSSTEWNQFKPMVTQVWNDQGKLAKAALPKSSET